MVSGWGYFSLGPDRSDRSLPAYSVTAGDVTGDGRVEIIGTWSNGIWYWDVAASNMDSDDLLRHDWRHSSGRFHR